MSLSAVAPPQPRRYALGTNPEVTAAAAAPAGEVVLALEGRGGLLPGAPPEEVERALRRRFPGRPATVLLTRRHAGEVGLVPFGALVTPEPWDPLAPRLTRGGFAGGESALRSLLQAGVERGAVAVALVAAAPHDDSIDWLGALLAPILEEGFDYVCPTYARPVTEGTLGTGIVYPLTRALYGRRLRQPLGGEVALSASFVRRLLQDPDWRRDPASAGSDAWLVAKALLGGHRACQSWLGGWPHEPAEPEDPSVAVSRVLGSVFREMERHAERWQRIDGSEPVPAFGSRSGVRTEPSRVRVGPLVDAFRLGHRGLAPLWALVLPPTTLLELRRLAPLAAEAFRIEDDLWARIVYDFAVAYFVKTMERHQLLASMTPLYLGWVASFVNEARALPPPEAEARLERLCTAFEAQKPYLIARWRWPDGFNP